MKTEHLPPARRTRRIELALHDDELDSIQAAAHASGHTPAAWVRHIALTGAPPVARPGGSRALPIEVVEVVATLGRHAHDLARLGNLQDQLVRHLNEMAKVGQLRDPARAAEAVKRVTELRAALAVVGEAVRELKALLLARV